MRSDHENHLNHKSFFGYVTAKIVKKLLNLKWVKLFYNEKICQIYWPFL